MAHGINLVDSPSQVCDTILCVHCIIGFKCAKINPKSIEKSQPTSCISYFNKLLASDNVHVLHYGVSRQKYGVKNVSQMIWYQRKKGGIGPCHWHVEERYHQSSDRLTIIVVNILIINVITKRSNCTQS